MTRSSPPQLNFSAGEIAPVLQGRTDFQRHQTGLEICRGWIPLRQGGITRAPGTRYLGRTRNDARARLIKFEFGPDDAVTLELTSRWMRFWRYGALIESDGAPYEIATPWNFAAVRRLQFVQSADVIYFFERGSAPRKLSRFALDDWTLTRFEPAGGPLRPENLDDAVTVQADGQAGTVTLTASSNLFTDDFIGGLFALRVEDWTSTPLWSGNAPLSLNDRVRYDGRVYEAVDLGATTDTGPNPPTHASGSALAQKGGPTWRFRGTDVGLVRITAVASGTSATATVIDRIPSELTSSGTARWARGAWSGELGWPSAVEIYEQRLFAGGTDTDPRTVWASTVGAFEDFATGEADQAFAYVIDGGRSLNRIVWLKAGARGLHVGGEGQLHSARSTQRLEALTPENAFFQLDATIGCHRAPPEAPDGRPIFITREQRRVFEMRYRFESDAIQARELSLPAEHFGAEKFDEITWQSSPMRMAWITREDGDPVVMLLDEDQDVLGWARYPVAGGAVESIAVTPALDGEDDVLLTVRREIQGEPRRHVELASRFFGLVTGEIAIARAEHFYAAVLHEPGGEQTEFDGLDHLEGESVHVWSDRGGLGPYVVSGGRITTEVPVSRAFIGLDDGGHLARTLDLYAAVPAGDPTGRPIRVRRIGLRLHRTAAVRVRQLGRSFGRNDVVLDWRTLDSNEAPSDLVAGWSAVTSVPAIGDWKTGQHLEFAPVPGAPATLLAVVPEVEARS